MPSPATTMVTLEWDGHVVRVPETLAAAFLGNVKMEGTGSAGAPRGQGATTATHAARATPTPQPQKTMAMPAGFRPVPYRSPPHRQSPPQGQQQQYQQQQPTTGQRHTTPPQQHKTTTEAPRRPPQPPSPRRYAPAVQRWEAPRPGQTATPQPRPATPPTAKAPPPHRATPPPPPQQQTTAQPRAPPTPAMGATFAERLRGANSGRADAPATAPTPMPPPPIPPQPGATKSQTSARTAPPPTATGAPKQKSARRITGTVPAILLPATDRDAHVTTQTASFHSNGNNIFLDNLERTMRQTDAELRTREWAHQALNAHAAILQEDFRHHLAVLADSHAKTHQGHRAYWYCAGKHVNGAACTYAHLERETVRAHALRTHGAENEPTQLPRSNYHGGMCDAGRACSVAAAVAITESKTQTTTHNDAMHRAFVTRTREAAAELVQSLDLRLPMAPRAAMAKMLEARGYEDIDGTGTATADTGAEHKRRFAIVDVVVDHASPHQGTTAHINAEVNAALEEHPDTIVVNVKPPRDLHSGLGIRELAETLELTGHHGTKQDHYDLNGVISAATRKHVIAHVGEQELDIGVLRHDIARWHMYDGATYTCDAPAPTPGAVVVLVYSKRATLTPPGSYSDDEFLSACTTPRSNKSPTSDSDTQSSIERDENGDRVFGTREGDEEGQDLGDSDEDGHITTPTDTPAPQQAAATHHERAPNEAEDDNESTLSSLPESLANPRRHDAEGARTPAGAHTTRRLSYSAVDNEDDGVEENDDEEARTREGRRTTTTGGSGAPALPPRAPFNPIMALLDDTANRHDTRTPPTSKRRKPSIVRTPLRNYVRDKMLGGNGARRAVPEHTFAAISDWLRATSLASHPLDARVWTQLSCAACGRTEPPTVTIALAVVPLPVADRADPEAYTRALTSQAPDPTSPCPQCGATRTKYAELHPHDSMAFITVNDDGTPATTSGATLPTRIRLPAAMPAEDLVSKPAGRLMTLLDLGDARDVRMYHNTTRGNADNPPTEWEEWVATAPRPRTLNMSTMQGQVVIHSACKGDPREPQTGREQHDTRRVRSTPPVQRRASVTVKAATTAAPPPKRGTATTPPPPSAAGDLASQVIRRIHHEQQQRLRRAEEEDTALAPIRRMTQEPFAAQDGESQAEAAERWLTQTDAGEQMLESRHAIARVCSGCGGTNEREDETHIATHHVNCVVYNIANTVQNTFSTARLDNESECAQCGSRLLTCSTLVKARVIAVILRNQQGELQRRAAAAPTLPSLLYLPHRARMDGESVYPYATLRALIDLPTGTNEPAPATTFFRWMPRGGASHHLQWTGRGAPSEAASANDAHGQIALFVADGSTINAESLPEASRPRDPLAALRRNATAGDTTTPHPHHTSHNNQHHTTPAPQHTTEPTTHAHTGTETRGAVTAQTPAHNIVNQHVVTGPPHGHRTTFLFTSPRNAPPPPPQSTPHDSHNTTPDDTHVQPQNPLQHPSQTTPLDQLLNLNAEDDGTAARPIVIGGTEEEDEDNEGAANGTTRRSPIDISDTTTDDEELVSGTPRVLDEEFSSGDARLRLTLATTTASESTTTRAPPLDPFLTPQPAQHQPPTPTMIAEEDADEGDDEDEDNDDEQRDNTAKEAAQQITFAHGRGIPTHAAESLACPLCGDAGTGPGPRRRQALISHLNTKHRGEMVDVVRLARCGTDRCGECGEFVISTHRARSAHGPKCGRRPTASPRTTRTPCRYGEEGGGRHQAADATTHNEEETSSCNRMTMAPARDFRTSNPTEEDEVWMDALVETMRSLHKAQWGRWCETVGAVLIGYRASDQQERHRRQLAMTTVVRENLQRTGREPAEHAKANTQPPTPTPQAPGAPRQQQHQQQPQGRPDSDDYGDRPITREEWATAPRVQSTPARANAPPPPRTDPPPGPGEHAEEDAGHADDDAEEKRRSRILNQLSLGALGKAARSLFNKQLPRVPLADAIPQLEALHPQEDVHALPLPPTTPYTFTVAPERVRAVVVKHLGRAAAPGLDGWTRELLLPLTEQPRLLIELATLVQDVLVGDVSDSFATRIRACILHPFRKEAASTKVRPITPESALLKVVSHIALDTVSKDFKATFKGWQYGVWGDAAEAVAEIRHAYEQPGADTLIALDATNAYNRMSRHHTLAAAYEQPALQKAYGVINLSLAAAGELAVYERNRRRTRLTSTRGVRQGMVLSPLLFANSMARVLQPIRARHPEVRIVAYLDDVTLVGRHDRVQAFLDEAGPQLAAIGFDVNPAKSHHLTKLADPTPVHVSGVPIPVTRATTRILGAGFRGDMASVETWVREKTADYVPYFAALQKDWLPALARYQLLRGSALPRMTHLLRTHRPEELQPSATWFDTQVDATLRTITEEPRHDPVAQALVQLPLAKGGLGLRSQAAIAEFAAACVGTKNAQRARTSELDASVEQTLHTLLQEPGLSLVRANTAAGATRALVDPAVHVENGVAAVLLKQRLMQRVLPVGYRCECGADADNYHVNTCRHIHNGPRIARHDAVVNAIARWAAEVGLGVRLEERADPGTTQKRLDLTVLTANGDACTDVTIVHPIRQVGEHTGAGAPGATAPTTNTRRASKLQDAHQRKLAAWSTSERARNATFMPLALESTGGIHRDGFKWLRNLACGREHPYTPNTALSMLLTHIAEALHTGNAGVFARVASVNIAAETQHTPGTKAYA